MAQLQEDSEQTRTLLEEVRAERPGALDRLLSRHEAYVHRLAELRLDPQLRPRVDPSDVVQEAEMEAVRRIGDYLDEPALPFRLWLRQIALDRVLMLRRRHLRAARRSVSREVVLPESSSEALAGRLLAGGSSPGDQLDRRELGRRVRQALAGLSEADREVVLLRNFEGLSNQEVARLLGIEPAAASQRYGRALLRLRKLLQEGTSEEQP
jgi:RNA polymerase sigma-70 factor (ECF subfamily)